MEGGSWTTCIPLGLGPSAERGLARLMADPIVFPAHALLIVEERLKEQQAEGVGMPEGVALDELALRVLVGAELLSH